MSNAHRRSFPAVEKALHSVVKTITAENLATGGKKIGAQSKFQTQLIPKKAAPSPKIDDQSDVEEIRVVKMYVPLIKATAKRIVTGVVLQPETIDAQGDIYSEDVISEAAGDFLTTFNKATKLGYMHKDFEKNFALRESYVAPQNLCIGGKEVKKGSWIITVKVKDDSVWKNISEGKIKGFSVAGKARVKKFVNE